MNEISVSELGKAGEYPSVPALPEGSYRWFHSKDAHAEVGAEDPGFLREDQGDYQDLGKILFKHNGYRPGPVRGWYIIARLNGDQGFAVGQMRADAYCPVQFFTDMIFATQDDASRRAEQLRSNRPGPLRIPIYPSNEIVAHGKRYEQEPS